MESLCYFVVEFRSTFSDMEKKCRGIGASLAVVDTPEKLKHIKEMEILADYR